MNSNTFSLIVSVVAVFVSSNCAGQMMQLNFHKEDTICKRAITSQVAAADKN